MKDKRIKLPIWIVLVSLVLSGMVMGVSVIKARQVQAQEMEEASESGKEGAMMMEEKAEPEAMMEEQAEGVEYYLSYPGILPDHPFYWLKMIRDRVQLWLTTKPLARAERFLLYADKRLGAGWALVEGNKVALGVTTLTKGEKYLEQAMAVSQDLGESSEEMKFKGKLGKAVLKHEEVLLLIEEKLAGEYKEVMGQMVEAVKGKKMTEEVKKQTELKIDYGEEEAVSYADLEGETAYDLLVKAAEKDKFKLEAKEYDLGILVESVDGKKNSQERAWIYFINGKAGETAADQYELKDGDVVEWKYIESIY